ncbi:hypothetical protein BLNAU_22417 [Blattamonas nauphoetae]|nr:hypothetical protein BLNAU_22417 [Blattamonas nauphoetae]
MREQFKTVNLVGKMFETVDFVSLPLSESETLYHFRKFIYVVLNPTGNDETARFEQYRLIRVSVFEPAKQFIKFIFSNSEKLILSDKDKAELENDLCWIHHHIKNMELKSDEHDADLVSELVKYEIRTMVEMENEENFKIIFLLLVDQILLLLVGQILLLLVDHIFVLPNQWSTRPEFSILDQILLKADNRVDRHTQTVCFREVEMNGDELAEQDLLALLGSELVLPLLCISFGSFLPVVRTAALMFMRRVVDFRRIELNISLLSLSVFELVLRTVEGSSFLDDYANGTHILSELLSTVEVLKDSRRSLL